MEDNRSAKTGRYVTGEEAAANPDTTVTEQRDPTRIPDSPGPKFGEAIAGSPLFTVDELREIATQALGAISVTMFQAGGVQHICDDGRVPDHDWLVMRDGKIVGYGELAEFYGIALDRLIEDAIAA